MTRARQSPTVLLRDESGAVAVITGISLVTLLLMASYVLDLAALRTDRAMSQSVSDMAAAAGALSYDPAVGSSAEAACRDALAYAMANLRGVTSPVGDPACADPTAFPSSFVCDPDAPGVASYTAGPYLITITIPVIDDDPRIKQQTLDAGFDGLECERIGVEVSRDRSFILGPVAGFFDATTQRGAVALTSIGDDEGDFASLIVLQRSGCETLVATGQAVVEVERLETVDDDGNPVIYPGVITVDTVAASCGASKPVIHVNPNGSSIIRADDVIYSYGLFVGSPANQVYNASRVPSQLSPAPIPGNQITRSPVDYLVNCLPDYGGTNAAHRWSPSHVSSIGAIPGCTEGTPAYVKELHTPLATLGSPGSGVGSQTEMDNGPRARGFSIFPDDFAGTSCIGAAASGTYGPDDDHAPATDGRRFYINCGSGGQAFTPNGIHFDGVETIIHRNGISMSNSTHQYKVDGADDKGAVIFLQRGGITRSGGTIEWTDVFVYVENGRIQASGDGSVTWRAALGDQATGCPDPFPAGTLPPAACFSPVALWSNAPSPNPSGENTMGGQSALNLAGSFFAPNATFNLGGQSPYRLDEAQFFAATLEASGQSTLTLVPNPDTNIETPFRSTSLIR